MIFHRLTVPTYFGGLPGGYLYINNATSGTPAVGDGPKANGPNAGTYLIGFGEDVRSFAGNRGLIALAKNTDALDDTLRRDFGVPTVLTGTAGGGGAASISLPASLWAGAPATPNTVEGIRTFVQVTDENDNEIYSGGSECEVTAITGATPGDGWVGGITLTISPPIPAGVQYKAHYYARRSMAVIDQDALVRARKYNQYSAGPSWADGTTNPLATVKGQLDKIVSDLSAVTGTQKVGGDAITGATYGTIADTLGNQLIDIYDSLNQEHAVMLTSVAAEHTSMLAAVAGEHSLMVSAVAAEATARNAAILLATRGLTELEAYLEDALVQVPTYPTQITAALTASPALDLTPDPVTSTDILYQPAGCTFKTVTTNARVIVVPLQAILQPHTGHNITYVELLLAPAGGHGALPAIMPRLAIRRISKTTFLSESLYSGLWWVDSSPDVASYEALHTVHADLDQNLLIDTQTYIYDLLIQNEGGTNSHVNLQTAMATVHIQMP